LPAALLAPLALWASAAEVDFPFAALDGRSDKLVLDRFALDGRPLPAPPHVRRIAPGVTEIVLTDAKAGDWSFAIADNSSYYGFGERYDRLNHVHTVIHNASRDVAGEKGSLTYQPIPFYMSLRGYGLWLDTTSEAVFDLNVSDPDRILVKCFDARLRIVLFEGPRFPSILDRFTELVGRQKLPPYWAFAPWKSRDYHRDARDVYEDVDRYRQLGLPASVLLIDSPWATNYNTYDFNRKQFANPQAMLGHIHDEGYKVVLWHTPWINRETSAPYEAGFAGKLAPGPASNFAEAERRGYFLHRRDGSTFIGRWWKGIGALLDFTNPAAKKWWQAEVSRAIAMGADGFKDDDAEGGFLDDVVFAGGQDWRLMRNRYAIEYNRAVAEVLQERKGSDWVLFQRTGTVGSHMLPMFWSGDNDASFAASNGLPTVVTAGLNAGMSGIPLWVSDLGGYNKQARTPGDEILFSRWVEYAAFSPGMEVMSGMNLGPWDYGDEALKIFRLFSVLHMSLFPYRYAAAQESARTGMPMMRALLLANQDDAEAREAAGEYLFGPDLLVAPVLSPVTQRALYLPAGKWIDFWTGRCFDGKQTIVQDAPLGRIPVLVREGAILPKIPEDVMTLVRREDFRDTSVQAMDGRRIYEIWPGNADRTITDFEGRTIACHPDHGALTIAGPPARVTLRWRFARPSSATVNGRPTGHTTAMEDGAAIEFDHRGVTTIGWPVR
jgi:alpha-D-xyloside xylohydrolase